METPAAPQAAAGSQVPGAAPPPRAAHTPRRVPLRVRPPTVAPSRPAAAAYLLDALILLVSEILLTIIVSRELWASWPIWSWRSYTRRS